jgi:sulfite reductase alpha subunit-like flavoprotein
LAKDVETALTEIVAVHGGRTVAEAAKFVGELKAQGRYQNRRSKIICMP